MRRRREELFDELAAHLNAVRPDMNNQVVCPLCLVSFGREALLGKPPALSEEHIIPKALGGEWVTLTCRKCNNKQGSGLDGHFVRMIRSRDSIAGEGAELKGTVRIGEAKLPMRISWGGGVKLNAIRILGGKAEALKDFQQRMKSLVRGDTVNLEVKLDYIHANAQRALLRMAYLILFERLGYAYVFSDAATFVRNVISGAHQDELWRFLPQLGNVERNGTAAPVIVAPIGDNRVTVAYLVVVRIDTKQQMHHAVILPAPTLPFQSVISMLSDVCSQLHGKRHSIKVVAALS